METNLPFTLTRLTEIIRDEMHKDYDLENELTYGVIEEAAKTIAVRIFDEAFKKKEN